MRIRSSLIMLVIAGSAVTGTVHAQSASGYPSKPIRIVVPFPPGGGADSIARLFGPRIHERLGQPLIVDNRSGAGTIIGGDLVAKAPADGHTLFMATFINAVNPSLRTKMPWDITQDFAPVSLLATVSYTLVVHPSLPARSVKELVALARSRPGQLNFGSAGNGTPGHLAGELLNSIAKLDMVHVPYKGAAPVLIDVLAGQVPITFGNNIATLPHIKSGRLRALAVTSARRSQLVPDTPTMIEGGLDDFLVVGWYPSALTAPRWGFYEVLFNGEPFKVSRPYGSYVMENVLFKISYPAGFHAQSAVECAVLLHAKVANRLSDIESIAIETHKACIGVLDKTGPLYNFADRDHCLQYMVAIGLLRGNLVSSDYEDRAAADPSIDRLRSAMTVREEERFTQGFYDPDKRSNSNAITVRFRDGSNTDKIIVEYPIGHPRRREEGIPLLLEKFATNLGRRYPAKRQRAISEVCMDRNRLECMPVHRFVDMWEI